MRWMWSGSARGLVPAVALGMAVSAMTAPSQAATPVLTPKVALPAAVDAAAFYEPQSVCDPTPQPGARALGDLLTQTYGPAAVYLGRACTSSTSEHFEGRAVDWMRSVRVPAQKAQVEAFLAWLLAPAADGTPQEMARRLGVQYVIWNNRMIRMYAPQRGWTSYNGCLSTSKARKSLDTSCHRNHVHLSLSWDGAAAQTSFWTGAAQSLSSCSARRTRASRGSATPRVVDPASVAGLVATTPTVILDTARGVGAGLAGPCRMRAGRSLYPTARVAGVVPDAARWAAVRVTSLSNAPARLAVWSSGASRPRAQVSTPIGSTTSTVLVPIASDGTIGLSTALGSARVSATVVGYLGGDPATVAAPTQATQPSAPRKVRAKSAKRLVTTRWKAPKRTGGSPITGYRVEALVSSKKGAAVAGSCTAAASSRSCTITGLTKGRRYWMSVSVRNDVDRTWAKRVRVRVP